MNIVAVLANGVGRRFGSNIPKQFHKVKGKMVIEYVIESILSSKKIDKLIIATNVEANSVYLADICLKNNIDMIEGGDTRNRSLKNVLNYINDNYDAKKLIVCDAVRPMITGELIDNYFEYLNESDAVVTAQKITDSLGCYDFQQVDRERYYLMQSPEAFDFKLLFDSFDSESPLTEVTQQLPQESKIYLNFDFTNNYKLTYPADLKYFEALISARDNDVDFSNILENVERLNSFLSIYYPVDAKKWRKQLEKSVPKLLKKWQITEYTLIKNSHFGIIFLAESVQYGACVLKIIPPFIDRYESERSCYQWINSSFMCELYDFDNECSSILLERCEEIDLTFDEKDDKLISFFANVINGYVRENISDLSLFKDYEKILKSKQNETDFKYKKELIMNYVKDAVKVFDSAFSKSQRVLLHGDLHRYNIMFKNGGLCAIDPIGYIAPKEFDIARYIGTELSDTDKELKPLYESLLKYFSRLCPVDKINDACYIDIVFRLHNSLFENEDYELTNKWLKVLNELF